jgi:hypothetical protein
LRASPAGADAGLNRRDRKRIREDEMRHLFGVMGAAALAATVGAVALAGQDIFRPGGPEPVGIACTYNISSGPLVACISAEGNVLTLKTPVAGPNAIYPPGYEGYCLTSFGGGAYDLGAFGQGGWATAALLAGGNGQKTVTIGRNTLDGRFRLEQKFTMDSKELDLTITNKIINIGTAPAVSVNFYRSVVVAPGGDTNDEFTNVSLNGMFSRDNGSNAGINAQAVSGVTSTLNSYTNPAPTCSQFNMPPPPYSFNTPGGAVSFLTNIGNLSAGKSKTQMVAYRLE